MFQLLDNNGINMIKILETLRILGTLIKLPLDGDRFEMLKDYTTSNCDIMNILLL